MTMDDIYQFMVNTAVKGLYEEHPEWSPDQIREVALRMAKTLVLGPEKYIDKAMEEYYK